MPRPPTASLTAALGAAARDRTALAVGGALLAVAAGFILADGLASLALPQGWDADSPLSIVHSGRPADAFNQIEFVIVAGLAAVAASRSRQAIYAVWAALFAFLLVDDLWNAHTRLAGLVFSTVDPPRFWRLRPEQVGKDLIWLAYGLAWTALLAIGVALSSPEHRRRGLLMLGPALAFFFFAFVVDMVQLKMAMSLRRFGAAFEEGGELVALALAAGLAAHYAGTGRRTGADGAPSAARRPHDPSSAAARPG